MKLPAITLPSLMPKTVVLVELGAAGTGISTAAETGAGAPPTTARQPSKTLESTRMKAPSFSINRNVARAYSNPEYPSSHHKFEKRRPSDLHMALMAGAQCRTWRAHEIGRASC